MLQCLEPLRGMDFLSVLLRIVLSCLCGAAIGLERSYHNRPAGFRTHILVCMGAAVAALTGLYLYLCVKLPSDIARISSQVISGLGFIGAGTILVTRKLTITGLTTAAGLWTTGIVGLAIGSGYYELGVLGTALVLLIEIGFGRLVKYIRRTPTFSIEVAYNEKTALDRMLRHCKDRRLAIVSLRIRALDKGGKAKYTASVTLRGTTPCEELLDKVRTMPGITGANAI